MVRSTQAGTFRDSQTDHFIPFEIITQGTNRNDSRVLFHLERRTWV